MKDSELTHLIIGAAIDIHRNLGPSMRVEAIAPIRDSVMLTYLRPSESESHLGLLINFNVPILRDGIRRYVWHYEEKDDAETQSRAEIHREAGI